jgi:hypothetical protein
MVGGCFGGESRLVGGSVDHYGTMAGRFDLLEEMMGQYASHPGYSSSGVCYDQGEVVATGGGPGRP